MFSLYKSARRKVFALIQKHREKEFRIRYLWAFGTDNLVRPLNNMGKLILKEIQSPTEQMWAYCVWKAILGIQMDKASELRARFADGIEVIMLNLEHLTKPMNWTFKKAAEMSEGQLDKMVADEETHFLNLCRNAITGLETQNILKKIQKNKEAATDKNKRDATEFTGSTLPNLSEVLPKVFDSPVVQVGLIASLIKRL